MAEVSELSRSESADAEVDDLEDAPLDTRAVREAGLAFFCGMLAVTVLPGGFTWLMQALFPVETAERLFPLVTLVLVLPIALLAGGRTRTFGLYLVLGMVISAVVVVTVLVGTGWMMFSL